MSAVAGVVGTRVEALVDGQVAVEGIICGVERTRIAVCVEVRPTDLRADLVRIDRGRARVERSGSGTELRPDVLPDRIRIRVADFPEVWVNGRLAHQQT
jgi:hypothetical protein